MTARDDQLAALTAEQCDSSWWARRVAEQQARPRPVPVAWTGDDEITCARRRRLAAQEGAGYVDHHKTNTEVS